MDAKTVRLFNGAQTADLRLFCFPYAGGGSSIYRHWGRMLPRTVAVCPVELPGHGTRLQESLLTDLPPLIEKLAAELRPYLDVPFAFFGHSMGALLSFELARYLRKHAENGPTQLFVSGHGAPQLPRKKPPTYNLSESDFLTELRGLNGTPKDILDNPELMQLVLPLVRADFQLVETYTYSPEPPLNCSITAFGGFEDDEAEPAELDAWGIHTTGQFTRHLFPGDHFFLKTSEPLVLEMLVRKLNQRINPPRRRPETMLV